MTLSERLRALAVMTTGLDELVDPLREMADECELMVLTEPSVLDNPREGQSNYVVVLPGGAHLVGIGPTIEAAVANLQAVLTPEPAPTTEEE